MWLAQDSPASCPFRCLPRPAPVLGWAPHLAGQSWWQRQLHNHSAFRAVQRRHQALMRAVLVPDAEEQDHDPGRFVGCNRYSRQADPRLRQDALVVVPPPAAQGQDAPIYRVPTASPLLSSSGRCGQLPAGQHHFHRQARQAAQRLFAVTALPYLRR